MVVTGISTVSNSVEIGGHAAVSGTPHKYFYGRGGTQAGGLSIQAHESALELVSSEDSTHGGSILIRTVTDGVGLVYNSSTNALEFNFFTPSSDHFVIHGGGNNVSSIDTQLRIVKDAAVELYHNGTKKFETTSTGASITGNLAVSGVLTYDDVTNVDSVGIITARAGINMPNNQYARFGNSQQFSVGHDNSNALLSYGTGTLFATGSTFRVVNNGVSENIIWAKADAEVELYYNNSMKFETTNTGVYVNGNIVVTGTVDGRDVATDGTKLDGIEASATADQTASEILTLIKNVD